MKIKVITGSTIYTSAQNTIKSIDRNDAFTPYFVVVPDRFTLQAERLLFKVLDIKSTFNINIVGLSSLAGKVIKEEKLETLSSLDGVLLVEKTILDNFDKLKYFKKITPALCQELYKTIQQMKSSKITPQNIYEKTKSANLSKKIADIKLIYDEYEKARGERIDSDDIIEIFAQKIVEKGLYKDSIFLFVGFDSFTSANYEVISALVKNVKEIRFAVSKPQSIGNAFIYENDILSKLERIAKKENVSIEVVSSQTAQNEKQNHLTNNLFSRHQDEKKQDYLFVTNSNTLREEVLFVAKSIRKAVYDGARFRDFAIVCPSIEEYKSEIEVCFNRFGIVSYIDTSATLTETMLARFVKKCFNLVSKDFLKEDILYIVNSDFVQIEDKEKLVAFVNEKNISGKERFEYYISQNSQLFQTLLSLREIDSYLNYSKIVFEITTFIEERVNEYIKRQEEMGFVQEASFERQSFDAIKEVVESFEKIEAFVGLKDFCSMLLTALESKDISSLPSFCDQVFIGDSTKSFFSDVKYLYVLGANAGKLPQNSNDNGLLTDGEIEDSCFAKVLEPTIKMINKRNRFKLFSLLAQAEERIVLSYLNFTPDGQKQEKAYFVTSLMNCFALKSEDTLQTNNLANDDIDTLLLCIGNKQEAKRCIGKLTSEKNKYVGSLRKVLDYKKPEKLNRKFISKENAEKLFFKENKVKVTQIEKFYNCPFKQFIDNGLKPVQKNYAKIKPNIYGSIMHNLLEDFVKKNIKNIENIEDKQIKKFINDNIERYVDKNILDFLPDKEIFLHEIKSNSFKLCVRAIYEIRNSKFKPKYFEKKFDGENLKISDKKVVGIVDRIDTYEDMFRVIDYKTGKITTALLSSLYYGEKLQLFLYGNSLKKELGLDFSGAFYFDAKISYSKNQSRILTGVFKPSEKILFALDKRLEDEDFKSSDLVAVDKISKGFSKVALTQPNLSKLEEYAIEVSKNAIEQMKAGFVNPCPNRNSCEFCDYKGICLFEGDGNYRALKDASKYFEEEGEDE